MIKVDGDDVGKRIDLFLSEILSSEGHYALTRSFLKGVWGDFVSVNDQGTKPSYKLKEGDVVALDREKIKEIAKSTSTTKDIVSQDGELIRVYETEDFLVLDKPKGMVVHPGVGNTENTLANFVKGYFEKEGVDTDTLKRAGIVHRLDKGVSGLIVFAKTPQMQLHLQKQFENHTVNKLYLADIEYKQMRKEIEGFFPKEDVDIETTIDSWKENNYTFDDTWFKAEGYIGRHSQKRLKMKFHLYESENNKYALSYIKPLNKERVLIAIKTGRMHQIRVTLEYYGIYIKGDTLYGIVRGTALPDAISLRSVFLGFKDLQGNDICITKTQDGKE